MKPLVSVVIPTYNRRDLVSEAINSVLCQTLADVEIIVVDDGSTDGTSEALADRYGGRIRYMCQRNSGRSKARNRGARASSGEHLTFLDSDDLLLPGALEILSDVLCTDATVGVAYGDGYYWDSEGDTTELFSLGTPTPSGDVLETLLITCVPVIPAAGMIRRSWLERMGSPLFDESLRGTEDHDFWVRLAALGCRFRYIDEIVCRYRLHGGNESGPRSPNRTRRHESLRRGLRKRLDAEYFSRVSVRTRQSVFWGALLSVWRDEPASQEEILDHPHFLELPSAARGHLLYHVGVQNIIDGQPVPGRHRLKAAVRLQPGNGKYRLMLFLSSLGTLPLGSLVTWLGRARRGFAEDRCDYSVAPHWRNEPSGPDPGR